MKKPNSILILRILAFVWCVLFVISVTTADADGWRSEPMMIFFIFSPAAFSLLAVVLTTRSGEDAKNVALGSATYICLFSVIGGIFGFYFLLPAALLQFSSVVPWRRLLNKT